MRCNCPDRAGLCKHLAASLYGVGARLDSEPELLFVLRGVRAEDLIEQATAGLAAGPPTAASATIAPPTLAGGVKELGELFGIELVDAPTPRQAAKPRPPAQRKSRRKARSRSRT